MGALASRCLIASYYRVGRYRPQRSSVDLKLVVCHCLTASVVAVSSPVLVVGRHEVAVLPGVVHLLELTQRARVVMRHHVVLAHAAHHLRRGARV